MSYPFENLQPEGLWKFFYDITKVPRPSKKEEKIIAFLKDFGESRGLETIVDDIGNVLIRKPATEGMKNRKSVVLQSHMDMVCEKNNDVDFDFDNDPIIPRIDGEWVKATGTTLGADDGIGVATQMAILDASDIEHGPIECLFTMDEETGLTGAFGLSGELLQSRILLNLDSEDEGELFIGCAGGRDTLAEIPYKMKDNDPDRLALKLKVSGLKGGHSGDEIHKGLGNANKLLIRVLHDGIKNFDMRLSHIDGGNLRNAIAREAEAVISIHESDIDAFIEMVEEFDGFFQEELHVTDPSVKLSWERVATPQKIFNRKSVKNLIQSVYACPHGVIAWSQDIENFVETSTNLASIKVKDGFFLVTTSQRSSSDSAIDNVCNMVASTFKMVDAKVIHTDGYPGWTPNPNSEIMDVTKKTYLDLFNKEPKVLAIHAGLECGLIGKKYPGMDMVSYGPTIKGAHSPDERLLIETVPMFWDHTLEILKHIPKK